MSKKDWTRYELDRALSDAQVVVRNSNQWEAIGFCRRLLAKQFPDLHHIIEEEGEQS